MSGFVGLLSSVDTILDAQDHRAFSLQWRKDIEMQDTGAGPGDLSSVYWPRGSDFLGDQSVDLGVITGGPWGWLDTVGGGTHRFIITGVTRDVNGSPIGGATVTLFQTTLQLMVDQIVSDPNGNYQVSSPYYPDAHFIVVYKTGSPDVFGTTANTLIGA